MTITLATLKFMADPGPVAANDDTPPPARRRAARWPLEEEFNSKRIGMDDRERAGMGHTVRWFGGHVEAATNPGCYGASVVLPSRHEGGPGRVLDAEAGAPAGVPLWAVDSTRDTSQLLPLERKARSMKIIRLCQQRLGSLFTYAVATVVLRKEMREIGEAEGVTGKESAKTAGRQTVVIALRMLAGIRSEVEELEDSDAISPSMLNWHFGPASNDNNYAMSSAA